MVVEKKVAEVVKVPVVRGGLGQTSNFHVEAPWTTFGICSEFVLILTPIIHS
jgi:hypothetical protein